MIKNLKSTILHIPN